MVVPRRCAGADGADHSGEVPAPPSGKSSRSTEVMTTCFRPSLATASATRIGSSASRAVGMPGAHVAETARAGTGVAHDHHRRVPLRPAFADVWAGGFLAHRHQPVLADQRARFVIDRVGGRPDPDPGGLRWIGLSGRCAFSGCRVALCCEEPTARFARVVLADTMVDGHAGCGHYRPDVDGTRHTVKHPDRADPALDRGKRPPRRPIRQAPDDLTEVEFPMSRRHSGCPRPRFEAQRRSGPPFFAQHGHARNMPLARK